jgi:hypothetical protein
VPVGHDRGDGGDRQEAANRSTLQRVSAGHGTRARISIATNSPTGQNTANATANTGGDHPGAAAAGGT